jgi:glycosyltransferase involved in cell wall biosynthesis
VPAGQVELIYYAVDQSGHNPEKADRGLVRREFGIADGVPVIGNIAYFYPPLVFERLVSPPLRGRGLKGHDVLIRAVPLVLQSIPDAKFLLVGRGFGAGGPEYEQQLKDLTASLGVAGSVIFTGERRDVPNLLAAFDVSTQCSLADNLAGTVESLLMARPLVASDIPGFADTVKHEETGLVVPPDDPPALAAAIVRLLRDPELAARLGENGRAWMLERFTLARTVADVEQLIARSDARAEQHYRLTTTLLRALVAPFRLLPVRRDFLTAAGYPSPSRRVIGRMKGIIVRALKPLAQHVSAHPRWH